MNNKLNIPEAYKALLLQSAKAKVDEIAHVLREQDVNNLGLLSGYAGRILFTAYYNKYVGAENEDEIVGMLETLFEEVSKQTLGNTFCDGLAGIAWLVEFLTQEGFLDANTDDILAELDVELFKSMMNDMKCKNYDFLHGGIGVGMYFLKRNEARHREFLQCFINELEELGISDRNGRYLKWESMVDVEKKAMGYNFSLSHGIASVVAFLAKVYEKDISKTKVAEMLDKSVDYLMENQLSFEEYNCCFPSWIPYTNDVIPSRLAWCYGDLGICSALDLAAVKTKNQNLSQKIKEILLKNVNRLDPEKENVNDACFCHGAAGIAHIYGRFANRYGDNVFHDVRDYWLLKTLEFDKFNDGLAGYKLFLGKKWSNESCLLEGIAGIGLVLMSYAYNTDTKWDECFLLT